MGNLFRNRLVTARTEIPSRTDIDVPVPYRQTMHVRFGQQEGRCNGCRNEFPFRVLEVDHIIPLGGGGQDNIDNLQLLRTHCNRVKRDWPQEYLNQYQGGMCISRVLKTTESWTFRISSGVSQGIDKSVVQSDWEFLRIGVDGRR